MQIELRPGRPADAEPAGAICYEAFKVIAERHGFPPDLPSREVGVLVLSSLLAHPEYHTVVAEREGRIAGSNAVDERGPIAGIGPITVDPAVQDAGLGRRLMEYVLERCERRGAAGIRLVQAAYHNRSMSLYTKLGFDAREPLSVVRGPPLARALPGREVAAAGRADLAECNRLCRSVHGHDRAGELRDAIGQGTARVVRRAGRITGYATSVAYFSHAVAETNDDLAALIADAPQFLGPGFLVPTRNAELLRWCLDHGLRIVQPMTLMTIGLYNEPRGAWLPSIAY
jgi:GNAT superfamily N-acetyltransferase